MRKYFLLSAVALLTATTANATTDHAEVTAKATIEVAGIFECDDIDFGTIVVKQQNEEFIIDEYGTSLSDDFISASGSGRTECNNNHFEVWSGYNSEDIDLTNENGDKIKLTNIFGMGTQLDTKLQIPANVKAGEYTGSFTITFTY